MRQTTVSLVFLDSSRRAQAPRIHPEAEFLGGRSIVFEALEVKREIAVTHGLHSMIAQPTLNLSTYYSPEFFACWGNVQASDEIE
jgi:hypothetical protein